MEFVKNHCCYSPIGKVPIKADLPQRHEGTLSHQRCSKKSCHLVPLEEMKDSWGLLNFEKLLLFFPTHNSSHAMLSWFGGTGELLNYMQKWTASKLLPAVFALEPSLSSLSLDSSLWINGIEHIPSFIYTEPSHRQLLWCDVTFSKTEALHEKTTVSKGRFNGKMKQMSNLH